MGRDVERKEFTREDRTRYRARCVPASTSFARMLASRASTSSGR